MAATAVNLFGSGRNPGGRVVAFRIAGDTSYPTGGYTLPAGTLPGGDQTTLFAVASTDASTARLWYWNNNTQKLQAFDAFRTEEGAATDVSADTITLIGVLA